MTAPKKGRPVIKAGTDGERIVIVIKTGDRRLFNDILQLVRNMPGAKFDWDEKIWHLPLTMPNTLRVRDLESVATLQIAPALGAWIADRNIIDRVSALEAAVARLEAEQGAREEQRYA